MRRRSLLSAAAFLAAAVGTAVFSAPALSQAPAGPEDVSFESADGVKLSGRFWRAKSGRAPCVILLPSIGKDGSKGWDDLGKSLADENFNVLRLDYRGHGKSTDLNPQGFWQNTLALSPINSAAIRGGDRNPPKSDLYVNKDYKVTGNYVPMLANDIMAARAYLDKKNDEGAVNTSSVYLIGATDAAAIGFLYMTAEWKREAKIPNLAQPRTLIDGRVRQFIPANADPAGKDIAGAVWLSPTAHPSIRKQQLEILVNTYAPDLRVETPMLFIAGKQDTAGTGGANMYFNDILVAAPKTKTVKKLEQTFLKPVEKTSLVGVALLGNDEKFKTESNIKEFLKSVEKERKNRAAFPREYTKPLPIALNTFGIVPN